MLKELEVHMDQNSIALQAMPWPVHLQLTNFKNLSVWFLPWALTCRLDFYFLIFSLVGPGITLWVFNTLWDTPIGIFQSDQYL